MQVGTRLVVNENGELIDIMGEYESEHALPRISPKGVFVLDIPYGSINWETEKITSVDLEKMSPVIEKIPVIETEDQKRIRELEDAILLRTEEEIGGIL